MRQNLVDLNGDSQYQLPGSWDRNSQYAPTPGDFGRTPSPSLSTCSGRFPERSSIPQQSEPAQFGFLPLADWEEGRTYNEQSPTYLQYLIEWRVALNNRVVAKDTEQDLVLAPSSYWEQVLRGKLDDVLGRKVSRSRRVRSDDTSIIVSVNDRSQRDLTKLFKKTDVDWKAVEKQLLMWGNLYRLGKKLRLSISFNYIEDSNPGTSKSTDKRGPSSVTRRILAEQDSQIDAERVSGHPSVWRDVYRVMRCPGPPCHLGPYCWQDPQGRKHYRLRTSHLTSLVKYVEQGGILETHDDVPGMVQ